jgi:hypothetical protein
MLLHGRLGVELEHKLVGLGVEHLFGEVEVWHLAHEDEERDVSLAQLECRAILHLARQQLLADQRPRLRRTPLLVVPDHRACKHTTS